MKTMKKGFTLIELLVVIAIIGILAATILIGMRSARAKARDTQRKNNVRSVVNFLELYADDNTGSYPAPTAGVGSKSTTGAGIGSIAILATAFPSTGVNKLSSITQSDDTAAQYSGATNLSGTPKVLSGTTVAPSGGDTTLPVYLAQNMEGGTTDFELSTAQ